MAQNQTVIALGRNNSTDPANLEWQELTNADVNQFAFVVLDGACELRGTVGQTPPGPADRGYAFEAPFGFLHRPVTDLFSAPGVNRVYARATQLGTKVLIDHA